MGTFDVTCFPFAENNWKLVVSIFRLQQANISCRFPLISVFRIYIYRNCSKYIYIYIFIYMSMYIYINLYLYLHLYVHINIYIYICCCFRPEMDARAVFINPPLTVANKILSFVRLFTMKRTEGICMQTN
jgi:hypothetical protein